MAVLLTVFMIAKLSAVASTETVTIDGITYRLDCMLTGAKADIGSTSFLDSHNPGSVGEDGYPSAVIQSAQKELFIGELVIPELINVNGVQYKVTGIGPSVFTDCTAITSVSLPKSIYTIGNYAFQGCTNITSVELPAVLATIGRYAFQNTGLTSLTISNDYMEIGAYAFCNCKGLEELTITTWALHVYDNTPFANCPVKKLYVNLQDVDSWLPVSNVMDLTFGPYVYNINSMKATQLTVLNLPKNIKSIGDYAFSGCNSLKTVISEIETPFAFPQNAFSSYSARLCVPKGAKASYAATNYWKKFSDIMEISDEPEAYVVYNNTDKTLTFYYDNQSYLRDGKVYTLNVDYSHPNWQRLGWFYYNESVTKVIFMPSFASARPTSTLYWFDSCKNLTEIQGMEYLNCSNVTNTNYMFDDCRRLTSVTIPSDLTTIGECMFRDCYSLTSVTIPSGVTSIEKYAFYGCI